ncbi:DUF397 domain-containing protein [Streptomyces sp. NPDC059650]|uniref:DUF397 domain-containing protein n=1 Tax=Streptomyces sp. NPDC059650 TaxID=3346896 RepID=UPI0036CF4440
MSGSATELTWFKSSYSGSQGDDCGRDRIAEQAVHVRDSRDVSRPAFIAGREGWAPFVRFAFGR